MHYIVYYWVNMKKKIIWISTICAIIVVGVLLLPRIIRHFKSEDVWFHNHYKKMERMVTMRDGVRLFTSIYVPKDNSHPHPILFMRTPYSASPYGENLYRMLWSLSYKVYLDENYIFVIQDVRGRYKSEGVFVSDRPFIENKKTSADVDEASDTYDSIDWLIKNIENNNGKVGVIGASYPGFYALMASLCGHPALKAVSAQAPVVDKFMGDDTHHNGVLFLLDEYRFDIKYLGTKKHPGESASNDDRSEVGNCYDFFKKAGTYSEITQKYMGDSVLFWQDIGQHPDYDGWWKVRDASSHLYNIKPAMLIVGGEFDAEDNYGSWKAYKSIKAQSPNTFCKFVEGPWQHSGWVNRPGNKLGDIYFGSNTAYYYIDSIEKPFFDHFLLDSGMVDKTKDVSVFITGENRWQDFNEWPPKNTTALDVYLDSGKRLIYSIPALKESADIYESDPMNPVPFTANTNTSHSFTYMCEDQSFAEKRNDVLTYKTDVLDKDITITGPVIADIFTSITTTDADFVVKLIDVFPKDFSYPDSAKIGANMKGYEMLVRGDIMRGRYRNSFENPEAFVPNQVVEVKFVLPDVAHCFKKGHCIMVQIQSTWFPLADRNPQQFINPYTSQTKDFVKSDISIYHDSLHASRIVLQALQ